MAIGTAAAILGSAAISAGASALSSSSSKKAVSKATDAQVQSNRESLALQRQVRDENASILRPYVDQGYSANNALANLAGLNGQPAQTQGFDTFRDTTGYKFRFDEGMKALNTGFAGRGVLNSGAAAKAAIQFGQDQGTGALRQYLSLLGGQQQVGVSAANALAGVGTTFANNATSISANTSDAIGGGALSKATIGNQFMNSIAGIAGNTVGSLSSYANPSGGFYGIAGNRGIY